MTVFACHKYMYKIHGLPHSQLFIVANQEIVTFMYNKKKQLIIC